MLVQLINNYHREGGTREDARIEYELEVERFNVEDACVSLINSIDKTDFSDFLLSYTPQFSTHEPPPMRPSVMKNTHPQAHVWLRKAREIDYSKRLQSTNEL